MNPAVSCNGNLRESAPGENVHAFIRRCRVLLNVLKVNSRMGRRKGRRLHPVLEDKCIQTGPVVAACRRVQYSKLEVGNCFVCREEVPYTHWFIRLMTWSPH